jgi:hypothetical protein
MPYIAPPISAVSNKGGILSSSEVTVLFNTPKHAFQPETGVIVVSGAGLATAEDKVYRPEYTQGCPQIIELERFLEIEKHKWH